MGSKCTLLARACVVCALLLNCGMAAAEPQNGWWWNPNESGRGFFIEMRGGVLYLAGYLYESNGRALWMTSGGPVTDPYLYNGTLQTYQGGQTLFGDYRFPAGTADVGAVTVRFDDDSHGTFTWPGGTIPIQRQIYGANAAAFQPHTGWWWNPLESGRGFSVEIQGSQAFIVSFMYDDAGSPVWYFSAGPMSTPTHFESDWLQFSGGQTINGPYRPPSTPVKVGRLAVDFTTNESATLTFTDANAAKASPAHGPRIIQVQPQLQPQRVSSVPEKWPYYKGYLQRIGNQIVNGYNQRIEYLYYNVRWDLTGEGPICSTCDTNAGGVYQLGPGARVKVTFDASGLGCIGHGEKEFQVTQGRLGINGTLSYQGVIGDEAADLATVSVTLQCGSGATTFDVPVKLYENFGDSEGIANFYPFNSPLRSSTPHMHVDTGPQPLPGGTFSLEAWFVADY